MADHDSTRALSSTDPKYRPLSYASLDATRDRLRHDFPGWRIWYVPQAASGHVTWCAQPEPLLNETSPEALRDAMKAAEYVTKLRSEAS